ncbi:MAG TPA: selenocysteine-specific translation elongation factor [Steroidobacteraceae bacterium]|nr:selenocysteine-specific translation elongation factor [Steroidobacteraceae bacterium]
MIIGTAGHIDHGKTSLVRALTGIDTDRLKEEKERGISIQLGYAYAPVIGSETLGFIDVPGHERLVHTMVAGAGGIDFALLVVAADDGVMPQTREHLSILELLGVRCGAVALSKIDRVEEARSLAVAAQIRTLLAPTALHDAPLFALNAAVADDPGVAALCAHLMGIAASWPMRSEAGLFRLAVDRVFTLPGRGTVATGTALAGRVHVGDTVSVMPLGAPARVRSIYAQNRECESGRAGQRCALNLAGIDRTALTRGDWLADPRALHASTRLDVQLRWLSGSATLANRAPLHVHLGTAHRVARVVLLETNELSAGSSARAQLVFDSPLCSVAGDLFIARDAQARHTVGGGVVIDPDAPARRRHSPERLAYLAAIQRLLLGESILPLLENSPHGVDLRQLVRLCSVAPERIVLPPQALIVGPAGKGVVILDAHWQGLGQRALDALHAFHQQHPDEPGIDRGRLRRMSAPTIADPVWRALIDQLVQQQQLQQSEYWLHLPEHRVSLSERERELAQKLQIALAAGRFDPPWVRELAHAVPADEEEVRRVLRKCTVQCEVYEVVRDLFYHRDSIRALAQQLHSLYQQHGLVEAADYRDSIGLGRKRTIQVLEFFDRVGYTRRTPRGRVLRADSSWREANLM